MALYTRGLGAIEVTPYGRIFKYADVGKTFFSGQCNQFQDRNTLLQKIREEKKQYSNMTQRAREDYNFFVKQTRSVGTPKYVYEGQEAKLAESLAKARDRMIEKYKSLIGLIRLEKEVDQETKGHSGIVTVCFYRNVWVEAHEKMHALLMLASGFFIHDRLAQAAQQSRFNRAVKLLLHTLGYDSIRFEEIFSRGLNDPIRTYEELLAGIAGVAQVAVEVRRGSMSADEGRSMMEDALPDFESYLSAAKLDSVPEFRAKGKAAVRNPNAYFLAISDFYYRAAKEFDQKYNGDLERAAGDFKRFYDSLA